MVECLCLIGPAGNHAWLGAFKQVWRTAKAVTIGDVCVSTHSLPTDQPLIALYSSEPQTALHDQENRCRQPHLMGQLPLCQGPYCHLMHPRLNACMLSPAQQSCCHSGRVRTLAAAGRTYVNATGPDSLGVRSNLRMSPSYLRCRRHTQ